jgi:hypothetical protein
MDVDSTSVRRLINHVVAAVEAAPACGSPFEHLILDHVFPPDLYAEMIETMPAERRFRALRGRHKSTIRSDGSAARVKFDLLPEFLRHLEPHARSVWSLVGQALRASDVRDAFVRRLASGLRRRFGEASSSIDFFAIPILTRDTVGYHIKEHTDTHWKGITAQIYLPPDESLDGIGTVFSERLEDGSFRRVKQIAFIPNHGYAFAVGDNTWHSVDQLDALPMPRVSILHTYFVDAGVLLKARNRVRRFGNLLLNDLRSLSR